MLKILAPLVFLLSASVSAAEQPLKLEGMNVKALAAADAPAATVVPFRADPQPESRYFNAYVLKAVDYLYSNYGQKGYDIGSVLTHDIQYSTFGVIAARHPPLTMCVAAQMEVILTAEEIYAKETGDYSLYNYLPKSSFEGLGVADIKGHIWVNPAFNANGTADALINFGMGERAVFEKLTPGSFVNINRTTKTGHAVTFLAFINAKGEIQPEYNDTVIGFKYFSSQGKATPGDGGLDYRYAVFSKFGCPDNMPYKRDCNVIYSADQRMLNTGLMLAPKYWTGVMPKLSSETENRSTVFNAAFFDGVTTDDK